MNMQTVALLSVLLSAMPATGAQAQVQIATTDNYLSGKGSTTIFRPVIPVQVLYLPSAYSDAVDTADATGNQYFAEDQFQNMAIGF